MESLKKISLDDIFSLLTDSVPEENASDMVKKCRETRMNEIEYLATAMDSCLPEFDNGYTFVFKTNDDAEARLEILEKDSIIMQAGIQIIYPLKFLFSKSKAEKHSKILKDLSDNYYGESLLMNSGGVEILNYGNISSVCYLSKMRANYRDVITFKVGNRKFW